ncbi:MAG: CoB--CoM heterodisulfide reductase iron-sulfur subunit B family protein [Actinomycetota bacterium]
MTYAFFPGCSALGTGRSYVESLVAVLEKLGSGLNELEDWNCCGATAWPSVDDVKAVALSARNLALAEEANPGTDPVDVVAPCAGCYRALLKAERALEERGEVSERVDFALQTVGLRSERRARTRHPLDVLVNEIGVTRIGAAVTRPLDGLKVACYYGCLVVRPYATFDDTRDPTSMDRLVRAIGGEPIDWSMKTRCCGGSCYCGGPLIGAMPEATLQLSHELVKEAKKLGADVIATVCPLCAFNLEGFQDRMSREFGETLEVNVGFITQLLGLALGLDERTLGIHRMLRWNLPESRRAAQGGVHAPA